MYNVVKKITCLNDNIWHNDEDTHSLFNNQCKNVPHLTDWQLLGFHLCDLYAVANSSSPWNVVFCITCSRHINQTII